MIYQSSKTNSFSKNKTKNIKAPDRVGIERDEEKKCDANFEKCFEQFLSFIQRNSTTISASVLAAFPASVCSGRRPFHFRESVTYIFIAKCSLQECRFAQNWSRQKLISHAIIFLSFNLRIV